MLERREHKRLRVLKTGQIIFDKRQCLFNCTIKNLSPKGALLDLGGAVSVPDTFSLRIPSSGDEAQVHVARRKGQQIGVQLAA